MALAALLLDNPVALALVVTAICIAGVGARIGRELSKAGLVVLPLAVVIALINALVSGEGLTVIVRLGNLPVLGQTDITLEAAVYGGVLGLRATALILCGALYTLAVDPDEVLRLFRRISFHSALTATLATRLMPVLVRDSRRLADAQRCRPGRPPTRFALLRAVTAGTLDRALDVAAALELRGYGAARRPPRATGRPWSRHDVAFATAGAGVLALAIAIRAGGLARFSAYPTLQLGLGLPGAAACAALGLCALAPFLDRRGIGS
ncbi:MAG: energy-coupling factor transporter transmembrane protein EcfT [Actinomycetota bacterium]|nr:energy-coupling factor transporter transmembrane protein EcfT [Actinomycetota bacterium]